MRRKTIVGVAGQEACRAINFQETVGAEKVTFSETVIAKMCSVVLDQDRIDKENLREVTTGAQKSFLVEAFDKILGVVIPIDFERALRNLFQAQSHPLP